MCSFLFNMCNYFDFGFSANLSMLTYMFVFHFVGGKMLTSERARFWSGGISQSRSEGNLIDMEARRASKNCNITGTGTYNCCNFFIHHQQLLHSSFEKCYIRLKEL